MPLNALSLVLAAAVAHAAWNILAHGRGGSGLPFLWWGALLSAVLWVPLIPFTGGLGDIDPLPFLLAIAVSGVFHVSYMLVLLRGYSFGDLPTVYATARGTGPTLTVLVAILLFGEKPGWIALFGVALVIGGVMTFGLTARVPGGRQAGLIDPGLLYGLLTGVAIAAYTVWDANAVSSWGAAPVAFMVGTSVAHVLFFTALLLLSGARGRDALSGFSGLLPELKRGWGSLLAFGVLSPLSYILVLTAVTLAPLSLVAPMREVSVILVSLYAAIRYREGRSLPRMLAAAGVVLGVILIGV